MFPSRMFGASSIASLALMGCAPEPYDTSCASDGDCVVVASVADCGCGECRQTVINKTDRERYEEDYDERNTTACEKGGCSFTTGATCREMAGFCANGSCGMR